jgi:RNA polymerase sigma factor (sigma-70 family)
MPPPPAEGFASRIFLGPALRAQPDGRLVSLVRQGYEAAFEEIVRRYNQALGRYAAAIVPRHRAEDVTQDAFSKALLALRHTEQEIELRPWLYRIVRNTALNDLRDQPRAEALDDHLAGYATAHDEFERREELNELMSRLRALPEPQRAAIVMRELEGLSHEEIAASLGLSGGGARQTIYRARKALREGAGMLVPMPILKVLLTGGPVADAGAAGAGAGAGGAALAGGGGAAMGLKAAAATVLVAGTVGTGIAIEKHDGPDTKADAATIARTGHRHPGTRHAGAGTQSSGGVRRDGQTGQGGEGSGGRSTGRGSSDSNSGPGSGSANDGGRGGSSGPGGGEVSSGEGGSSSGPGGGGRHLEPEHSGEGGSNSGPGGGGSSGSGSGSHEGSGESGSGSSGPGGGGGTLSGEGGSGESGGSLSSGPGPGPELPEIETSGSGSGSHEGSGSSGSGGSGSGSGTSGSGSSGEDPQLP